MLISNYGMQDSSKETSPAAFDPGADFGLSRCLTETQRELVEKFNCAFYEAQGGMRTAELAADEILETFDETYFTNIEKYDEAATGNPNADNENYLLDYLIAKNDEGFEELVTPSSDCTSTFDYDEFSENFEQFNQPSYTNLNDYNEVSYQEEMNQFYVAPPFETPRTYDVDISSSTSDGDSVYYPNYAYRLPPVTTIKNNIDFTNFIRQDGTSLKFAKASQSSGNFGHVVDSDYLEDDPEDNQLILTQTDSLIYDDPMIGGSTKRRRKYTTGSDASTDCEEAFPPANLQCKWENCYEIYESQSTLVRHIEKSHVELKRGEEFTCFWVNCPRKNKPFNARYKLLIHMRVHSGEKPNKCQFKGCNKAFSRLENLKIHQRSHTGERPYLCQFPNCTKSFSNSSDRAKHQRTHYDTKPYACQVYGCVKKYTDPSSLRKHIKNHSLEEQQQVKNKCSVDAVKVKDEPGQVKKFGNVVKRTERLPQMKTVYANLDHSYSHSASLSVKQDLKNRLSEKINKNAALYN